MEDLMPRGAFAAVLACTVLCSVEPAFAECRTSLPPASERAGHWQYRMSQGKRCWYGPLKAGAPARARVVKPARVVARAEPVRATTDAEPVRATTEAEPVRATTGLEPLARLPVIVTMPMLPAAPPIDDDEIWPKPDASFAQRFDAIRLGR